MGAVYEAVDLDSGGPVALKLFKESSPADRKLFESEIKTLGSLQHENIVRLVDAGVSDNRLYFTMEYLQGMSLAGLPPGPPPSAERIEWLLNVTAQVLSALEYIHDRGIIHGDLKPSNIMVLEPEDTTEDHTVRGEPSTPGKNPRVKLLDFGLARGSDRLTRNSLAAISEKSHGNATAGTPLYMPPEQLAGDKITERSDFYSLGALLYHLITGRPPFENMTSALTRKPAPPAASDLNTNCTRELAEAIFSFMEEVPHKRPGSAAEAAGLLAAPGGSAHENLPLKPRLMRPVFVGREKERNLLLDSLDRSCGENSLRAIRVVGEGGIGKSWLFHSSGLKTRAELEKGARVLASSFRRDGLGKIFLEDPATEFSDGFRRRFGGAGQTGGEQQELEMGGSREGSNDSVITEAAGTLRHMALARPLVIILEDLQEAPDEDIELLERLVAALDNLPILMLFSYREEAGLPGSALDKLGNRLERMEHPAPLRLGQLEDHAVEEYVESVLSPRLPATAGLLETLGKGSRGNPLALHRALGRLVTLGALVRQDSCWSLVEQQGDLPETGDGAVLIDSLSPTGRLVLTVAGLLAETFDGTLLACVLEDREESELVPTTIASLVSCGFLIEDTAGYRLDPGFPFENLLGSSTAGDTRKLHERIATLLLELNPSPGSGLCMRIAGHLDEAGKGAAAFAHYLDAARLGSSDYSNQLSEEAYCRALELAPEKNKPGILHELARLHQRCGRIDKALQLLLEAEKLETPGTTRDNRIPPGGNNRLDDIARVLHRQGRLDEAEEYFLRSMALAGDDEALLARTCYGLAGVLFDRRDFSGARDHYQRSLNFYAGSTEPRKLVPLHLGLALIDRIENKYDRSIEHFKEALRLARETGNLLDIARIQGNLANTHRVMGELAIALEYLEESTRTRKLVGDKQGLAVCLNNLSRIQNHRGELQAALEATEEALSTFEDVGDRKGIAITRCNLGELLLLRGRPLDAKTMLEACGAVDRENEGSPLASNILCNLARVELVICEYPRAEELFQNCLSRLRAEQDQGLRVHVLAGLAEIYLARGMEEAAEDALLEAEELTTNGAGQENLIHLRGLRMRLCRQRGDLQESIELARDEPGDEAGRYGTANLDLELGAAYRDLGPDWADKTEKYLTRAAGEFENMGCPVEAAEALGELSVYWRLTGEEETAAEKLQHAEKLLSSGQLKPRLSRFTEVFKARSQ